MRTREEQMMDAADRYADEVCDESCTGAQVAETINDFCAGWRAAYSYPNWISVEDELPPPHYEGANSTDFVLVYDGFDVEFGYYDFGQKNWHGENYKEMMFKVTHWMPMPQPPRKEE